MTETTLTPAQMRRVKKALTTVPYAEFLGLELAEIAPGRATLVLPVRKELTQNHGVVHGGAVASLIDSATAFAIITLLEPKERVTTIDLTISYLRPVTTGQMRGVARVIRAGRRVFCASAEVFDSRGRLTATALTTYIKI